MLKVKVNYGLDLFIVLMVLCVLVVLCAVTLIMWIQGMMCVTELNRIPVEVIVQNEQNTCRIDMQDIELGKEFINILKIRRTSDIFNVMTLKRIDKSSEYKIEIDNNTYDITDYIEEAENYGIEDFIIKVEYLDNMGKIIWCNTLDSNIQIGVCTQNNKVDKIMYNNSSYKLPVLHKTDIDGLTVEELQRLQYTYHLSQEFLSLVDYRGKYTVNYDNQLDSDNLLAKYYNNQLSDLQEDKISNILYTYSINGLKYSINKSNNQFIIAYSIPDGDKEIQFICTWETDKNKVKEISII